MRDDGLRFGFAGAALVCAVAALAVAIRASAAPAGEGKLSASDPADGREFGSSVAVFGDTAILGAPDAGAGLKQGSAYVFTRAASVWTERKKLTADDGETGDFFGAAVALQGNTAVVGAHGLAGQTGAAYVFTGSGSNWTKQQKLVATDPTTFSRLGQSVAIDGDTVVVGAPAKSNFAGAAYVFTRTGAVWTQQAKLTASDGAASDQFGVSVAIEGDTVVVGAFASNAGQQPDAGAAYVFTRTGAAWTQRKILVADDGATDDFFGVSVALSRGTALVGAQLHDVAQRSNQGAAYVFTGSGATWTQEQQLLRTDGGSNESFGVWVALEGDTALVGAMFADNVPPSTTPGAVSVFERHAGAWTQTSELFTADTVDGDQFGASLALHDGTAIVGALGQSGLRGAAYAFSGLPASALSVTTTKGSITNSPKPSKDAVSVACKVDLRPNSDGSFLQADEALRISIGNAASPLLVEIPAGLPPTTAKLNGRKQTLTRTWKSAKGVHPKTTVKLVAQIGAPSTLTVTASSFDLPVGAATGLIRVQVEFGADAGGDTDAWRTKKTKRVFP